MACALRDGKIDTTTLKSAIELCRVIKFPHEIELIKRANDISAQAHRAVLQNIRNFQNERQVEGIFLDTCVSSGAHEQAYSIIAGAGTNAAVLHYIANNAPFNDSQVLLLDAGAEFDCYASDVTRTFPISGEWSAEAKNIYDAVNDMQAQCIARIRPGVHFRDLQILAMAIAVRWLLKLGVLHNGSLEEILRAGTIRAFFPHGLGHHVGLEVHDVLSIPIQSKQAVDAASTDMTSFKDTELHALSAETIAELYTTLIDPEMCMTPVVVDSPVLEPGMVVTVEPGIYFSDFALSKVYLRDPAHLKYINTEVLSKYMPIGGVRIEDDVLVTKKGYANLTTAPKGDEALKIIRGEVDSGRTSVSKGKAPAILNTTEAEDSTTSVSKDLYSKCSINVKQRKSDCLPPRDESNSLLGSFPFGDGQAAQHGESSKQVPKDRAIPADWWPNPAVVPLSPIQQRIIDVLRAQPFGRTISPEQIAEKTGLEMPRIVSNLVYLCTHALVRQMKGGSKFMAVGKGAHEWLLSTTGRAMQTEGQKGDAGSPPPLISKAPCPSATVTYLVRTSYDFHEPDDQACLSFKKDDAIWIKSRSESGWLYGVHRETGQNGWLPENYVKRAPSPAAAEGQSDQVPATEKQAGHSGSSDMRQVRENMIKMKLRSVFAEKLSSLLTTITPHQGDVNAAILSRLSGPEAGAVLCFSGLCMQMKQENGNIDFSALPGSGTEKLRKLYEQIDEALKLEFSPGHVFHRMEQQARDELYTGRWKCIGVKEESSDQFGICGSCHTCREGFIHWDERWLLDSRNGDEE